MPPLPPGALDHLLRALSPERHDPFPHLLDLTPDPLLQRRSRSSWDNPLEVLHALNSLQSHAKKDGPAERLNSTHLVMIQTST